MENQTMHHGQDQAAMAAEVGAAMQRIHLEIDGALFARVAVLTAYEDRHFSHEALGCVHICPRVNGGAYMVGINGHSGLLAYLPDLDGDNLPSGGINVRVTKGLMRAAKGAKGRPARLVLDASGPGGTVRAHVVSRGETTYLEPVGTDQDQLFPSWRNFFNEKKINATAALKAISVPPRGLERFTQPGDTSGGWCMYFHGAHDPVFLRNADLPDLLGVIMPMNDPLADEDEAAPAWLDI